MPDGNSARGWLRDGSRWYYLDPASGRMQTGWIKPGEKWFFLNPSEGTQNGAMLTGWQWIDGYCYYFSEKEGAELGAMAAATKTPDGYSVDADGRWTDESGRPQFVQGKGFCSRPVSAGHSGSSRSSGEAGDSGSSRSDRQKDRKPDGPQTPDDKKPDGSQGQDDKKPVPEPEQPGSEQDKEKLAGFVTVSDYEGSNILAIRKTGGENLAAIQEKVYQRLTDDAQRAKVYFLELDAQVLVVDLNDALLGDGGAVIDGDSAALGELIAAAGSQVYYADQSSGNLLCAAPDNRLPNSGADTELVLIAGELRIPEKLSSRYLLGLSGNSFNGNLVALESTKEVAGINFVSDHSVAAQGSNGSMLSIKSGSNDFSLLVDHNSFRFQSDDAETQLYRAIGIYSLAGELRISKNRFSGRNIKNSAGSQNAHGMIDCQARLSGSANKDKYSRITVEENLFQDVYSTGVMLYTSEREALSITGNSFRNIGEDAVKVDAVSLEYPLEHSLILSGNEIRNYGLNENTGYTDGGFGPLGPVNSGESGITINYYDGTQKGSKVNGSWHSSTAQLVNRLKADNHIATKEENDRNQGVVDSQPVIIGQRDRYIDTAQKINQAGSPAIKNHSVVIVKDENGDVVYGHDASAPTEEITVKDLYITGQASGIVTLPSTLVIKGNLRVDLPNGFVKLEAKVGGSTEINASRVKNSALFTPLDTSPIPRGAATGDYAVRISDIRNDDGEVLNNPALDLRVTLGKQPLGQTDYHYAGGVLYVHKEVINRLSSNQKLSIRISSAANHLSELSSQLILIEISNMSGAQFEYSGKRFTHMNAEAPIQVKVSGLKNNKGELVDASRTKLAGNVDFLISGLPQDKRLLSVDDATDTVTLSTELLNYLYATRYESVPDRNANFGMHHSYELVINDAENHIYEAKDSVEFEVIDRSGVDFVFEKGMTFTQGNAPAGGITLSVKNVTDSRGNGVPASRTQLKDSEGQLNMTVEPFPVQRDDSEDSELIVLRDQNGKYLREVFNPKYLIIDDERDTITFTKEYLDRIEPRRDSSTERGIKAFTFTYFDANAGVDVRSQKIALHVKLKEKALSDSVELSFRENTLLLEGEKLKFHESFDTKGLIVAGVLKNIIKHNPRQRLLLLRDGKPLRSFDSVKAGDRLKVIAENGVKSAEYTLDFEAAQSDKLYRSFDETLIAELGSGFTIVKSASHPTIERLLAAIVPEDGVTVKVVAGSGSDEYEPVKDSTLRSDMTLILSKDARKQRYGIRLQDGVQYRALLIGNQNYGEPKMNLKGPENDIRMMSALFRQASFGGERFAAVRTEKNLKKREFLDSIARTFANSTDEDVSYLYYSGHGYNVKSNHSSYICTVDKTLGSGSEEEAAASWISVDELKEALDKVAGTKVIILDCCNAGGFIGKEFVDSMSGATPGRSIQSSSEEFINSVSEVFESGTRGAAGIESSNGTRNYLTDNDYKVLVASSANEYSYESKKTAAGKFTLEFVRGAGYENGQRPADEDHDGKISLGEMYSYLMDNVESTSHIQVFPQNDDFTLLAEVDEKELNSSTLIKIRNSAYIFEGRITPEGEQLGTIRSGLVKIDTRMTAAQFMEHIEKSHTGQALTLEGANGTAYANEEPLRKLDTYLRVVAENGKRSRYPVVVEQHIENSADSSVVIEGNSKIRVTADEEKGIYAITLDQPMKMDVFMKTVRNINRKGGQNFKLLDSSGVVKQYAADVMVEHLDQLLVTSKNGSRKQRYTITVLSGGGETIESEYTLRDGVLSSGSRKLSTETTVKELKDWLAQNHIDLSDPMSGVYRKGTNPPFGRAKAERELLEEGDRFIVRDFFGKNKIYTIELEAEEPPKPENKLAELTPDFGDALSVENGRIRSGELKLNTNTKLSEIMAAWKNRTDFDGVIDEEKTGIYSGSTVVISGVPNKPKKSEGESLGYGYKLILIPADKTQLHVSYELEPEDEGGGSGPIVIPPVVVEPDGRSVPGLHAQEDGLDAPLIPDDADEEDKKEEHAGNKESKADPEEKISSEESTEAETKEKPETKAKSGERTEEKEGEKAKVEEQAEAGAKTDPEALRETEAVSGTEAQDEAEGAGDEAPEPGAAVQGLSEESVQTDKTAE